MPARSPPKARRSGLASDLKMKIRIALPPLWLMISCLSAVKCFIAILPTPELVALWVRLNVPARSSLWRKINRPFSQIVGRNFDRHAIARECLDPVLFHSAGGVGNEPMSIIEFNAISGVGQNLGDEPLKFQ